MCMARPSMVPCKSNVQYNMYLVKLSGGGKYLTYRFARREKEKKPQGLLYIYGAVNCYCNVRYGGGGGARVAQRIYELGGTYGTCSRLR